MNQHTLNKAITFSGKGLHTGAYATMTIKPAPIDHGIVFLRTDIGPDAAVAANALNVASVARSTILAQGEAKVITTEHLLSALVGMGVDNALVEIDNMELPILDGSAKPYTEAIMQAGLAEQQAPRRFFTVSRAYEYTDEKSGSRIEVEPSDHLEIDLTVDFNSEVLGVQSFHFEDGTDYAAELAPCRTFCFLHELEMLLAAGLIKGGDMDNAIVVVERPASEQTLEKLCKLFGVESLSVSKGYLNNLQLHFDDEIVRHKTLDLMGDFALLGAPAKMKIKAYKPGHGINTSFCKMLMSKEL